MDQSIPIAPGLNPWTGHRARPCGRVASLWPSGSLPARRCLTPVRAG